jgi:hypothetical protein
MYILALHMVVAHAEESMLKEAPHATCLLSQTCKAMHVATKDLREAQRKRAGVKRFRTAFIKLVQEFFPTFYYDYADVSPHNSRHTVTLTPSSQHWHPTQLWFWQHKSQRPSCIMYYDDHRLVCDTTELPVKDGLKRGVMFVVIENEDSAHVYWGGQDVKYHLWLDAMRSQFVATT